jgi:hypothetical protein
VVALTLLNRRCPLLDWPAGDTMHDFKIGQYVSYQRHKAEGRFVVIGMVPQTNGKLHYVIRSPADPERNTVEASELRRVPRGR